MTRAEKMIAFIETLRTPDGAGVGQPFVLRGWQKAIIREVYDAEDGEGRRVVRQAVLSMSRKNGKPAFVESNLNCFERGFKAASEETAKD